MHRRPTRSLAIGTALATLVLVKPAQAQQPAAAPTLTVDSARYAGLQWRSIGPYRGGRVTAVAGVPAEPLVYYMGATGGGVWKTEDGGNNWRNISDGYFRVGSVGAIAVADEDPNVIYVGTGESPVRGVSSSWGDGVYKSTDGGRTWAHVGLTDSRQISGIVVHPRNSDIVYVAAQGSRWGPSTERGVYRSTDGGTTWSRVLYVDSITGPSSLVMDPTNPRILYVSMWDHDRTPWRVRSGGKGSGIHKSTDGGTTWTKLAGGLPAGIIGKSSVSVSHANPDRVFALIEADSGGLYRSDNGGKQWTRVNDDRLLRARAWYYIHVHADPSNADVVWVMNAPLLKSIDGGRTFTNVPVPHGDNHALWINPHDSRYVINGNDGGANVSFDGGRSWSTQSNQPTAQFYRVNTDARFPYSVYAGQQDNSSVAVPSRTFGSGIDFTDWHDVGGCESARPAFDPANPRYVYAGCYQGIISEYDADTRVTRNVMAYPALGLAEPSDEQKYRFNWSAPIITSPHDRSTIYHGGNVLLRSTDRGRTWTAISPDLTRNEKDKQGPGGGPITNEGAGGEVYNTIYDVVESPHERGVIWIGTDDGLVHLTRDGGAAWSNVTPRGLGEATINAIEVSPHDRGTAYLAVNRFKWNDNAPYIFRTTDYGKTWTRLTKGIRDGDPVRVVREDPTRRNLLYAGTESGMYLSLDGGANWQPWQLNLPRVPVTDLQVRERDLVASTEGRAFWILDDLSPLYAMHDSVVRAPAFLFAPRGAYRVYGMEGQGNVGRNPPPGALLYYHLAQAPDSADTLRLEILDAEGTVVRALTSRPARGVQAPGVTPPRPLPTTPGLHRVNWDLRGEDVGRVPGMFLVSGTRGYRVPSGSYRVRLTIGGMARTQPLDVLDDPRLELTAEEASARATVLRAVHRQAREVSDYATRLGAVRVQAKALAERVRAAKAADTVARAADSLAARASRIEERLVQPRARTFQDVVNFRNGFFDQVLFLAESIDETDAVVTGGMTDRMAELATQWTGLRRDAAAVLEDGVRAVNALAAAQGVGALVIAPPSDR